MGSYRPSRKGIFTLDEIDNIYSYVLNNTFFGFSANDLPELEDRFTEDQVYFIRSGMYKNADELKFGLNYYR